MNRRPTRHAGAPPIAVNARPATAWQAVATGQMRDTSAGDRFAWIAPGNI